MDVFASVGQAGVVVLTFDNNEKLDIKFQYKMSISVSYFKDKAHDYEDEHQNQLVSNILLPHEHTQADSHTADDQEMAEDNESLHEYCYKVQCPLDSGDLTNSVVKSDTNSLSPVWVSGQETNQKTITGPVGCPKKKKKCNGSTKEGTESGVRETDNESELGGGVKSELIDDSGISDSLNQSEENVELKDDTKYVNGLCCQICEQIFHNEKEIIEHGSGDIGTVPCSLCKEECLSSASLFLHKFISHHKKGELCLKCPLCVSTFRDYLQVVNHLKFKHTKEKGYKCCACLNVFQDYTIFEKHVDHFRLNRVCNESKETRKRLRTRYKEPKANGGLGNLKKNISDSAVVSKISNFNQQRLQTMNSNSTKLMQCKSEDNISELDLAQKTGRKNKSEDGTEKSWHKCDVCERLFKTSRLLRVHTQPNVLVDMCKLCGAKAYSRAEYLVHEYTKHSEEFKCNIVIKRKAKSTKCPMCEEMCSLKDLLNHVMFKHTNECPYTCCICDVPVENIDAFTQHIKVHQKSPSKDKADSHWNKILLDVSFDLKGGNSDEDRIVCRLCKEQFGNQKDFILHCRNKLLSKVCNICGTSTFTEAGYIVHGYLSHGLSPEESHILAIPPCYDSSNNNFWEEDRFGEWSNKSLLQCVKCPCCPEDVNTKDLLFHVMEKHTHESPFKCCACQNESSSLNTYINHCNFHLGKKVYDSDSAQCIRCNLRFESRQAYTYHQGIWHRNFTCSLCHTGFGNSCLLDEHITLKHKEEAKSCSFCGKLFCDDVSLAWHERNHYYQKKIACPVCGEILSSKRALSLHTQSKHSEDKDGRSLHVLCNICGVMISRSNIMGHSASHSNQLTQKCDICNKRFKHRSKVLQHVARVHMKHIKSHICEVCGKNCSTRHNLKIHMRIHSSVKAFSCSVCGQGFNYNQSLQAHINKKHRNERLPDYGLQQIPYDKVEPS